MDDFDIFSSHFFNVHQVSNSIEADKSKILLTQSFRSDIIYVVYTTEYDHWKYCKYETAL